MKKYEVSFVNEKGRRKKINGEKWWEHLHLPSCSSFVQNVEVLKYRLKDLIRMVSTYAIDKRLKWYGQKKNWLYTHS